MSSWLMDGGDGCRQRPKAEKRGTIIDVLAGYCGSGIEFFNRLMMLLVVGNIMGVRGGVDDADVPLVMSRYFGHGGDRQVDFC